MDELTTQVMSVWWGLLFICVGMGVMGLAQVREWDSREEFARVATLAMVLMLLGLFFVLGGPK